MKVTQDTNTLTQAARHNLHFARFHRTKQNSVCCVGGRACNEQKKEKKFSQQDNSLNEDVPATKLMAIDYLHTTAESI